MGERGRFRFSDPFFHFYYRYVYRNASRLDQGDHRGVEQDIRKDAEAYYGAAIEVVAVVIFAPGGHGAGRHDPAGSTTLGDNHAGNALEFTLTTDGFALDSVRNVLHAYRPGTVESHDRPVVWQVE